MPYSKTPEQSTYTTKRIPLAKEINTRLGTTAVKDEDFLNCYIELVKKRSVEDSRTYVTKRAGAESLVDSQQAAAVRGMHYWTDRGKVLYAVGNDIYVLTLSSGAVATIANPFGTTTGKVGFCEYLYDTGNELIVATDGTTLITIDNANAVVTCADADLPAPHVPTPIFLDGYLFLIKTNTSDIYNSDLNDPMAWTPGNLISAEIEGDWLQEQVKINNYLVVFGKNTIEYFWDAAVETGSPLQRNDSVVKHIGYIGGLARHGRYVFMVGSEAHGQLEVYQLEDLKVTPVGSPVISRYLNNSGATFTSMRGNVVSISGYNFYVLYAGDLTYVYDIENKLWTRWAFQADDNFPITYAVNVKKTADYYPVFALDQETSELYNFSDAVAQDDGTNYTMSVVTEPVDFDSLNRKNMHRLVVIADRPDDTAEIDVQWSDDDYQTYTTARTVDLDQSLPSLTRLGSFRRRAFKLSYTGDQPVRLQELEVDINRGNS
jgi:hypothetical protein